MQRLKTRPQFQAVLAGALVAKTAHFALHREVPERLVKSAESSLAASSVVVFPGGETRLGAMVPKRWAKRAVTRNAIRRQIYTVAADFSDRLPKVAFVIRLRREFAVKTFVSARSRPLTLAVHGELLELFETALGAP